MSDKPVHRSVSRAFASLVGDRVVKAERAPWGFATPTRLLTLASSDRVVLQRVCDAATADRIREATRVLGGLGIQVGPVRAEFAGSRGTWMIFDHVVGKPGPALVEGPTGGWLADRMGEMLARLTTLPQGSVAVDPAWESSRALARASPAWVSTIPDGDIRAEIRASIARLVQVEWIPVTAHGDFVPANVMIREDGVLVLLDLGGVAGRHPLLDEAWWGLIVRYHHGRQFQSLFDRLQAAASLGRQESLEAMPADVAVVRALQLYAEGGSAARRHLSVLVSAAVAWSKDPGNVRSEPP